jgi:hypothetical protein
MYLKKILGTAFLGKKFLGNKIPWSAVHWNDIPWKKISLLCRITNLGTIVLLLLFSTKGVSP